MDTEQEKKKMKWYMKLLYLLLAIVISPLILCFLLWAGISAMIEYCKTPIYKKEYYQSDYYKDLKLPYKQGVLFWSGYLFYNSAKEKGLSFQFIHQSENGEEYLIKNHDVFFFQPFDSICYDDGTARWEIDEDGDWRPLEELRNACLERLDEAHKEFSVHFLVTKPSFVPRSSFSDNSDNEEENENSDYAIELLPSYVHVGTDLISAYIGLEDS